MSLQTFLFRLQAYIHYLKKAKTRYGLHSPFVYALTDKCLYDKKFYPAYKQMKVYRKSLGKNRNFLKVHDTGAGSSYFKSGRRRIKDLLRVSSASMKEMKLWYRLSRYFQARRVLELGAHLGVSTYAWALGAEKVTAVEGDPVLAGFAQKQLQQYGASNVELVTALFDNYLQDASGTYDILFLDGDHTYEATMRYYPLLKKLMHEDSLLILHDIHWSPGMQKAWEEIIRDPEMHVTIDLFCCGLVFKRPGQYKEHFVIRF